MLEEKRNQTMPRNGSVTIEILEEEENQTASGNRGDGMAMFEEEENQTMPGITGDSIVTLEGEGNHKMPGYTDERITMLKEEGNHTTTKIRGDDMATLQEEGNLTTPGIRGDVMATLEEEENQTTPGNRDGAITVTIETPRRRENETETKESDEDHDGDNIMTIEEIFASTITKNIHSITSELLVMESLIHEEKQLGAVQCRWNTSQENSTRKCFLPSVQDERFGWIAADSKDEYGKILEAKFAYERRGPDCAGVSLYFDGAFFQLLTEYSDYDSGATDTAIQQAWYNFINNTDETEEGNMIVGVCHTFEAINATADTWLKECTEDLNSDATGTDLRPPSTIFPKNDSDATNAAPTPVWFNFKRNISTDTVPSTWDIIKTGNATADTWLKDFTGNQSWDGRGANSLQNSSRINTDAEVDASVTAYEDFNYTGYSTVLTGAVDITQPWNTTISSLRFPQEGWSAVAFDPYGGLVA